MKKKDILAFMEALNLHLAEYYAFHQSYPDSVFLTYLRNLRPKPCDYQTNPNRTFPHILKATGLKTVGLYPKFHAMDWTLYPAISLANILIPLIDEQANYYSHPPFPPHADLKQYVVPGFSELILKDCQGRFFKPEWKL